MMVRWLRLHNFRNYAAQEVEFPEGLVALTGLNGQGKTNLLEALCVLATTKSPLVERDRELIRWGERDARLASEIELSVPREERRTLEYAWRLEGNTLKRELRAGGVPQSAIAQWLGQLQVVAFFPHDLTILTGEPAERRRFLNLELGKTRPAHFADSARYRRALQQRNALLRHLADLRYGRRSRAAAASIPLGTAAEGMGTLAEWNRQVVTYGARILEQRSQFLVELTPLVDAMHRNLSGVPEPFRVAYSPGVKLRAGALEEGNIAWSHVLSQSLEADHDLDLRRGTTGSGPHRDDLTFRLGEMDLRRYGSQGQQRLAILALKLALAQWVRQVTSESPILLLDDALSELDERRRALLLDEASHFSQCVLTATDSRFVQGRGATEICVAAGRVVKKVEDNPEVIL